MTTDAAAGPAATATRAPAAASESSAPSVAVAVFPDFASRNDMMNPEHLHDYGNQPALRLHLGNPEGTIVLGEVPIYEEVPRSREGRAGVRVPDCWWLSTSGGRR